MAIKRRFPALPMSIQRFQKDQGGNVALISALTVPILLFSVGMGTDYSFAGQRQAKLNAVADEAALSAVTPTMMTQTPAVAQAAALKMFLAQAALVKGIGALTPTITVSDSAGNTSNVRTATVTYTTTSINNFAGVLGTPTIAIKGLSTSTSAYSPNIDFYLMLDDSPSMGIAATPAGIATMIANTPKQGGCAFACHEQRPDLDYATNGNPNGEDNYQLARNLGVALRIDNVSAAAQSLMDTAKTTGTNNKAVYRMAIFTFDYFFTQITPHASTGSTTPTANLTAAKTDAATVGLVSVYQPNWITSTINDGEGDTNWDAAIQSINKIMPTPGNGTNNTGDTPQEILFIVSDGVLDTPPRGSTYQNAFNRPSVYSNWCTTIKNRGIRIAFLYTTYQPITNNSWYNTYVGPYQSQIGPVYAQGCASAGLYTEVDSGGDITSAMNNLFNKATATAHLTQ